MLPGVFLKGRKRLKIGKKLLLSYCSNVKMPKAIDLIFLIAVTSQGK
jgi:hypothetical protein